MAVLTTLTTSGLFGQLEEQTREFSIHERTLKVEVTVASGGSAILLRDSGKVTILSAAFPGENLFPKVITDESGDGFAIAWMHYRRGDVQIGLYDSHTEQSRLIRLHGFESAAPLTIIFKNRRPLLLLFSGAHTGKNTDVFCHHLLSGTSINLTGTPEPEQSFTVTIKNGRFMLDTATLHHHRRYLVRFDSSPWVKTRKIRETEIIRPFRPAMQTAAAYNVIAGLGDSITWGTIRMNKNKPADEYHPENAYLAQLQQKLGRSHGKTDIINLGVPSETSFEATQRFPVELAGLEAYFLLVLFGTNDVTDALFNAEATAGNIEYILNSARDTLGMYPIAATIPPQKRETDIPGIQYFREQTEALNGKIREMALANGFPFIDIYSAFFGYGDWQVLLEAYKGNHPSPLGHDIIADLFMDIILSLPPKTPYGFVDQGGTETARTVAWSSGGEFDFKHHLIRFGFHPDRLDREVIVPGHSFTFVLFPFYRELHDTIYYRVQAVDKDGNGSPFSSVGKVIFGRQGHP